MFNQASLRLWLGLTGLSIFTATSAAPGLPELPAGEPRMLTQPMLQNPTEDSVSVVWFTNFEGRSHRVIVRRDRANDAPRLRVVAKTRKLDRLLDDQRSRLETNITKVSRRTVYRHEAVIESLEPDVRRKYRVVNDVGGSARIRSDWYELQPLPSPGKPLKILLTSDQQERFRTLANYQVVANMFPDLAAIFFAGDLVNHPRRAAEWFDNFQLSWRDNPNASSPPFFPAMQGFFRDFVPESPFAGGELLQNAPLFPAIANHEVSGRFRPNASYELNGQTRTATINSMYGDPHPRWYAELKYQSVKKTVNPTSDPAIKEQWILDNSNDFETYRDIFTLPDDGPEGESYYSKKIGEVFLIAMNVSRIWRTWNVNPEDRGKFIEILAESNNPDEWGFGEHIFTPFAKGTSQHAWLRKTLRSDDFKASKYRVVMFHQSAFGLGDNAVPVLTDPVMHIQYTDELGVTRTQPVLMPPNDKLRIQAFKTHVEPLLGSIEEVRYKYPVGSDYFARDVEPLLHQGGVQLVLVGHSHVWNRSKVGNLNFMETSNVGNCFGAYWTQSDGTVWRGATRASWAGSFWNELAMGADKSRWDPSNYARVDDPQGRQPIMPTEANPMMLFEDEPEPVPFVCSNKVSTFSILDTELGMVRSFAFDTTMSSSSVIEFDRFKLIPN